MYSVTVVALVMVAAGAEPAKPRLTKDMGDRIVAGVGKLAVEELCKSMPATFRIKTGGIGPVDWTVTWDELTAVHVEFLDGNVRSVSGTFSDTVVSETLTPDRVRQIAIGMTRAEVEKLFGGPNWETGAKDVRTCNWSKGRRVFAQIKGGKVVGGGFLEGNVRP